MNNKIFQERWNKLDDLTKKCANYLQGNYVPPIGTKEIPRRRDGRIDLKKTKVDAEKYLLVKGVPHPHFKNLFYKGPSYVRDTQLWKEGEWEKPKTFSQLYGEKLREVGLSLCSTCKQVKNKEDFGQKNSKNGKHQPVCGECSRSNSKKYYKTGNWRERYKEQRKSVSKRAHHSMSGCLRKQLAKMGRRKNENLEKYLGCPIEFFLELRFPLIKKNKESFYDNWDYNIDHIIPKSVACQIEKRKLFNNDKLERLIMALWHYSNLTPMDADKNKFIKSDYVGKERVRDMSDEKLIKLAEDIIKNTEDNRRKFKLTN